MLAASGGACKPRGVRAADPQRRWLLVVVTADRGLVPPCPTGLLAQIRDLAPAQTSAVDPIALVFNLREVLPLAFLAILLLEDRHVQPMAIRAG
jgi:hypothetical protein